MATVPKAPQLGLFHVGPTVHPAAWTQAQATLAKTLPANLALGTSSWSFPGWEGLVYAGAHRSNLLSRQGLSAFADHPLLSTVSIDRGYYAPIPEQDFVLYQSQVPATFRFVVKAWRQLTTPVLDGQVNSDFLDPELATSQVIQAAQRGLEEKLDCILFQFPPMHLGQVQGVQGFCARLSDFLAALPTQVRYAVEVRTPELLGPALRAALMRSGCIYTINLMPTMPDLDQQFRSMQLADQPRYLVRWLLARGYGYQDALKAFSPFDGLKAPSDQIVQRLAQFIRWAETEQRHFTLQVNNKAEGSAPLTLQRIAQALAGSAT